MKLIPTILAFSFLSILPIGCSPGVFSNKTVTASGAEVTGTVEAKNITEIISAQGIEVNYTVGSEVSVSYSVPESLSPYLQITFSKGELKCKYKDGTSVNYNGRHTIVNVTAPNVNEFDASSASQINVTGQLSVEELETGASSGASIFIASVKAYSAEIDSSSAASITITSLEAKTVEAEASSGASINVCGDMGTLNASASSAGQIDLGGSLTNVNLIASSAGDINASKAQINTGSMKASSAGSITVSKATGNDYTTSKSSGGKISIR